MVRSILLLMMVLAGGVAGAQTVDVKGVDSANEGSTTIEIKKNKPQDAVKPGAVRWTTEEGSADVEGDAGATNKEARGAWKKACDAWKKEFRDDNKDNKILSINCGSASCDGDAGNKMCTSKARYKIRTKASEGDTL